MPYPLHLGVTEAGTPFSGSIKSAVGMGALLVDGIGDTMRVSLTADPVEGGRGRLRDPEGARPARARAGDDRVPELRPRQRRRPEARRGGRGAAERVPAALRGRGLGCAVNGPGEAGDADFGIAGGRDVGFVYAHGRVLKKVSSDILVDELFFEIDRWIADGMHRPKRLKMAKPAALAMAEASLIPLE